MEQTTALKLHAQIIASDTVDTLTKDINGWLTRKNEINVIDIKYQSSGVTPNANGLFSELIIYTDKS